MRTDNAADIRLDVMLENSIFYIFTMYEFSHSLGQKRTFMPVVAMSAFDPKRTFQACPRDVRFGPRPAVSTALNPTFSIGGYCATVGRVPNVFGPYATALKQAGMPKLELYRVREE